jgi:hypothetical protein
MLSETFPLPSFCRNFKKSFSPRKIILLRFWHGVCLKPAVKQKNNLSPAGTSRGCTSRPTVSRLAGDASKMKMSPIKTANGWEIWDGVALSSEIELFPDREAAQAAADACNREMRRWENQRACDAPHLDNF